MNLTHQIKQKLNIIRPPAIVPYLGYGKEKCIHVSGHVLENRPEFLASDEDSRFNNLKTMIARYLSTAIPGAEVTISFNGQDFQTETDEDGFFSEMIPLSSPAAPGWHPISLSLKKVQEKCESTSEVCIVSPEASFGVISDIDDTVLVSHATQLLRKLNLVLFENSKTRLPFPGVKEFYDALAGNLSINPIFYVSSSEWNLYDFLLDFFATQKLPKGPLLLQRYKQGLKDLINTGGGDHSHKRVKIDRLFQFYPEMSFVLIGDSGQRDPEIYGQIVKNYPGRVKAVYIRAIKKDGELQSDTVKTMKEAGVPVIFSNETKIAFQHAKSLQLIHD